MSNEHHEFVVIGAGPAGMAAATTAAELGLDTVLLDEQLAPGGQIYRGIEQHARHGGLGILGGEYRRGLELAAAFRASGAGWQPESVIWQASPDGRVGVITPASARMLRAERILLATGAMERPVPVPGWTKLGVMGAGAVQALLKGAQVVPDVPVVIAGSGPLIFLVATQLARAGCRLAAVLVTTPATRMAAALGALPRALLSGGELMKGIGWIASLRRRGIPMPTGVTGLRIEGAERAEAVSYEIRGTRRRIEADLVILHEGVIPNVQLSLAARCRHVWDEAQACWRPETDVWGASTHDRIAIAGDGGAIHGADAAEPLGRLAALDTAFRLGRIGAAERDRRAAPERAALSRHRRIRPLLERLFRPVPEILAPGDPEVVLCRCEAVTVGALRGAIERGGRDPNRAKLLTRCGMGPCQGRMCGSTVAAVIAREAGCGIDAVGPYRIRIPVRPLPLPALAELAGDDADLPAGEATL